MLLSLTRATAGTVRAAALARVGAIVEEPRFHRYLTGRENLAVLKVLQRRADRLGSRNDCGLLRGEETTPPKTLRNRERNSTLRPMAGGALRPRVDHSPTTARQEEK